MHHAADLPRKATRAQVPFGARPANLHLFARTGAGDSFQGMTLYMLDEGKAVSKTFLIPSPQGNTFTALT